MGDWIYKEIPHVLPVLSDTVTCLILEVSFLSWATLICYRFRSYPFTSATTSAPSRKAGRVASDS